MWKQSSASKVNWVINTKMYFQIQNCIDLILQVALILLSIAPKLSRFQWIKETYAMHSVWKSAKKVSFKKKIVFFPPRFSLRSNLGAPLEIKKLGKWDIFVDFCTAWRLSCSPLARIWSIFCYSQISMALDSQLQGDDATSERREKGRGKRDDDSFNLR